MTSQDQDVTLFQSFFTKIGILKDLKINWRKHSKELVTQEKERELPRKNIV